MLSLPAGWVEELSRELRPEAFAPGTHGRGLHVALTYRTELPDLLEQRGHTMQSVVTDLTAGFTIEPRTEGARESYQLTGSRFAVTVSQMPGRVPGRTVAVVTSIDPVDPAVEGAAPAGVLIEASVSFHLPYEEVAYDVAALHTITEETELHRRAAREQAAALLAEPAQPDTDPGEPRARLLRRYGGLDLLLELLGVHAFGPQREALQRVLDRRRSAEYEPLARLMDDPASLPAEAALPGPRVLADAGTDAAPRLDAAQGGAVAGAVTARHVFAVAGPAEATEDVIVETIRQLLARGERVLLMAATWDAVDLTLSRVADQDGVLALRLPGDDLVPAELRGFTPDALAARLTEAARRPDTARARRWGEQIRRLAAERDQLRRHLMARHRLAEARTHSHEAVQALEAWESGYQEHRSACADEVTQVQELIRQAHARLGPAQEAERQAAEVLAAARTGRAFTDRLAGLVRSGETARLSREHRRAARERKAAEDEYEHLVVRLEQAQTQLRAVIQQGPPEREKRERACVEYGRRVAEARRALEGSAGPVRLLLGDPAAVADAALDGHARRREAQAARLEQYARLERRWFGLFAPPATGRAAEPAAGQTAGRAPGASGTPHRPDRLGRELVQAANLVCCTYADTVAAQGGDSAGGLLGAVRDSGFDTLVVAEAGRLRDTEFLVGAVRARRWVIVGDESDPEPPTRLGAGDEYELLAVAALARAGGASPGTGGGPATRVEPVTRMDTPAVPPDTGAGLDLDGAVADLERQWPGVTEFPAAGVRAAAERLRDNGDWDSTYRPAVAAAERVLGADVAEALVRAVHAYRTPDFFAARLAALPEALCRRLAAAPAQEGE